MGKLKKLILGIILVIFSFISFIFVYFVSITEAEAGTFTDNLLDGIFVFLLLTGFLLLGVGGYEIYKNK